MKRCLIIFLLSLFIGCNKYSEEELKKLNHSKYKIVYIENAPDWKGKINLDYGSIVAFDIENNNKYIIENNSYINDHPAFMNDGRELLFLSVREVNEAKRDFILGNRPHQFYKTSLKDLEAKLLYNITVKESPLNVIKDFTIAKNNVIYFLDDNKTICRINNGENNTIKYFNRFNQIENFEINQGEDKILLKVEGDLFSQDTTITDNKYQMPKYIFLYDLKSDSLKKIFDIEIKSRMNFGKWSSDGILFYDYETFYIANNEGRINLTIEGPFLYKNDKIIIDEAYFYSKTEIIFIGWRHTNTAELQDIYLYDINERRIKAQITNDGYYKDCLDVYLDK